MKKYKNMSIDELENLLNSKKLKASKKEEIEKIISEKKQDVLKDDENAVVDKDTLNKNLNEISSWIKTIKFRKQIFGGVQEKDVWRRVEELNRMYEIALRELSVYYETVNDSSKDSDKQ